ncbi:MAG TPA: CBS domain-containing protein [Gaiellaceae bacterium]|nr:CBS domain-containing protein [Gaiellaceae bacterium]
MKAPEVIATHQNTDFDAFASLLAVRRLYPDAVIALHGTLNRNVREFYRLHADQLDVVEASRLDLGAIRRLVVVETISASRLGELEAVALDPDVETVVFDHHAGELPEWVEPGNAVISQDGALTTTLVGVLAEREIAVTPIEATALALGIHEDTGSLTYPTATQRDADALAWCLRHGARQDLLARFLHTPLTEDERDLLSALMAAVETERVAGVEVVVSAVSWPRHVDGVSNLAHKVVDLTDCRALVLLVEMDDRVFAVTRSRAPEIDAAGIAALLGGGGHFEAASAIFRGSLDDAREILRRGLPDAVREPVRARQVMSRPARSVGSEESVAAAMVVCQRYQQSGILVVDGGELVGAVGREDLDKAIAHGLSHAPVKGIMSSRVVTVASDAPLAEVQEALAGSADGRLAVVEHDKLVGVVTRSDVLRALGEQPEAEAEPAASLREELARLEHLQRIFEAVAAVSEPYDGVYLVGGTVRDILLGEPNFDVDIAVEGDAIELARSLADAVDGRVRAHRKFGTAVVLYGDEATGRSGGAGTALGGAAESAPRERVDVVTARTEFYDAPAALPSVEHASIREDLFRRDFTINAMAVSLKGDDFGRLVDPFHGRRDLETRTIRILHNLSFIDDPTRIFRAIRYESRYGFRMDEHTQRLARGTIEMGLVGDLSSARLRDELVALLEEGDPGPSILRLAELGAGAAIHPHLAADDEAVGLLGRLRELNEEYGTGIPAWRLAFAVLARRMTPDEVYGWLQRLKVQRRDGERIASAVTVAPRLVERLRGDSLEPADVVAAADPYAPDAPLLAMALEERPELDDYFRRLRNVQLEVSGSDLAALGLGESPEVGEILAELRRRKLNGQLDGRESELAAARELISTT